MDEEAENPKLAYEEEVEEVRSGMLSRTIWFLLLLLVLLFMYLFLGKGSGILPYSYFVLMFGAWAFTPIAVVLAWLRTNVKIKKLRRKYKIDEIEDRESFGGNGKKRQRNEQLEKAVLKRSSIVCAIIALVLDLSLLPIMIQNGDDVFSIIFYGIGLAITSSLAVAVGCYCGKSRYYGKGFNRTTPKNPPTALLMMMKRINILIVIAVVAFYAFLFYLAVSLIKMG